ncbi:MAG: hypothetical protein Q8L34_04940 [Candidatus Woesearchaeota archaeon]|nr:hypothetical protein [Candidatus Woesearchaeota archaeon]
MSGIKKEDRSRSKIDLIVFIVAIIFFLFVIIYCVQTNFNYYIADSVIFIGLSTILFVFYKQWRLNAFTFFALILGFILHDLGAFRFYASSPVPVEWDVVTHLWGIFAVTLFIYNIVLDLTKKSHHVFLFFVVILAGLGFGVLIEFLEFYGFMTTGFGEGFFGRGFGDFDPSIVSSDYIDTIQDLFWNFVGATIGFIVSFFREKKS